MSAERTWLVLGASSTIARAFARQAAAAGADILLAGRDLEDLERTARDIRVRHERRVEVLAFDATDTASHDRFVERCRELARRLDVYLAFGLMPDQNAMEARPDLALETVAANYAGAVSILLRLAPMLEAQGEGRVVIVSSVAGDRGRLKNYVYGSAKAGVSAFAQGLRARLFRHHVWVTTVKPGFIDTAMTFGLKSGPLMATPDSLARACLVHAARGTEVIYHPAIWRLIMLVIRLIPEPIMKRLNF